MTDSEARRAAVALGAALIVSALVFTLWPDVDLWFSGLFYDPAGGFRLAQSPALELWRNLAWNLSIVTFVVALAGLAAGLAGKALFGVAARVWGFVAALYLLGPILLVDRGLKEHWGRARPANVAPFGGPAEFTPALVPSDQCTANCAFVSGEGSAAVALAVAMLAVGPPIRRRLGPRGLRVWYGAAGLIAAGTLLQRIATGRHFLSDSVFATIFVLAIALILRRLILVPGRRGV